MSPECLILIARLCLPTETMSVEFSGGIVGRAALARLPGAELRFDLWSDGIGGRPDGMKRYCKGGACLHYKATADRQRHRRGYEFRFDGDSTPQPLSITAPSAAALEHARRRVRVLLTAAPGGSEVLVSLSELER